MIKEAKIVITGDKDEAQRLINDCSSGDLTPLMLMIPKIKAEIKELPSGENILGKKARDKITGFEGIIIGKAEYLFGCTQYGLAPEAKDGKCPESLWFDEGRVEVTGDGVSPESVIVDKNGGPQRDNPNNRA
jgi:hypothetical protein